MTSSSPAEMADNPTGAHQRLYTSETETLLDRVRRGAQAARTPLPPSTHGAVVSVACALLLDQHTIKPIRHDGLEPGQVLPPGEHRCRWEVGHPTKPAEMVGYRSIGVGQIPHTPAVAYDAEGNRVDPPAELGNLVFDVADPDTLADQLRRLAEDARRAGDELLCRLDPTIRDQTRSLPNFQHTVWETADLLNEARAYAWAVVLKHASPERPACNLLREVRTTIRGRVTRKNLKGVGYTEEDVQLLLHAAQHPDTDDPDELARRFHTDPERRRRRGHFTGQDHPAPTDPVKQQRTAKRLAELKRNRHALHPAAPLDAAVDDDTERALSDVRTANPTDPVSHQGDPYARFDGALCDEDAAAEMLAGSGVDDPDRFARILCSLGSQPSHRALLRLPGDDQAFLLRALQPLLRRDETPHRHLPRAIERLLELVTHQPDNPSHQPRLKRKDEICAAWQRYHDDPDYRSREPVDLYLGDFDGPQSELRGDRFHPHEVGLPATATIEHAADRLLLDPRPLTLRDRRRLRRHAIVLCLDGPEWRSLQRAADRWAREVAAVADGLDDPRIQRLARCELEHARRASLLADHSSQRLAA